jgi:hypothetical protein
MLLHGAGIEVEDVGHHPDLPPRVAERLAHVRGLEAGELLAVLFHQGRHATHESRAISRLHGTPRRIRRAGSGDGPVRLLDARSIQVRDRTPGRGVQNVERHPRSNIRSRSYPVTTLSNCDCSLRA